MPMVEPTDSFDEIKRAASALLPGVRQRRRLFFRYTMDWIRI
jgi:hypothetical protein